MMFHKTIAVGNLGKDPQLQYTPAGASVCTLSVACNRRYRNSNDEQIDETVWFRVHVWGNQGEACQKYLRKGSQVLVEGRLIADKATGGPRLYNRRDGAAAAGFEIYAETVRFLGKKAESRGEEDYPETEGDGVGDEEQIPF